MNIVDKENGHFEAVPVDEVMAVSGISALESFSIEVASDLKNIREGMDVVVALEEISEKLSLDTSETDLKIARISIENLCRSVGMNMQALSLEQHTDGLALENVVAEKIHAVGEAILKAIRWVMDKIKSFIAWLYNHTIGALFSTQRKAEEIAMAGTKNAHGQTVSLEEAAKSSTFSAVRHFPDVANSSELISKVNDIDGLIKSLVNQQDFEKLMENHGIKQVLEDYRKVSYTEMTTAVDKIKDVVFDSLEGQLEQYKKYSGLLIIDDKAFDVREVMAALGEVHLNGKDIFKEVGTINYIVKKRIQHPVSHMEVHAADLPHICSAVKKLIETLKNTKQLVDRNMHDVHEMFEETERFMKGHIPEDVADNEEDIRKMKYLARALNGMAHTSIGEVQNIMRIIKTATAATHAAQLVVITAGRQMVKA